MIIASGRGVRAQRAALAALMVLAAATSIVADADPQVGANSPLGFGSSMGTSKQATDTRQQANKIVGDKTQGTSDTAAIPDSPADQIVNGRNRSDSDQAFERRVKNDLVSLSTRIGKLRNENVAVPEEKNGHANAAVAQLDERWQKLEQIASQWSDGHGALRPQQRADVALRLNQLKSDVAKQEAQIKKMK